MAAPILNLSTLNGSNGFRINGIAANDQSGRSISSAGDVNGDGIDDLIIGAYGADPNGSYSGQSYVVFGSRSGFAADFVPSALNGSNGFRINGIATFDFSGRSVSSAGDVNGDGIDDLIIGATDADPNGSYSGQSYVVFGSRSGFAADLNLSTLNGSNGFRINGIAAGDSSGRSVSSAGDVNGDGIDDLIIGANGAAPNGTRSGQSYVVFSSRSGFGSALNLSTLNGSNGFRINGIAANDYSGRSVSSAGDVNGDGLADLIIGAARAAPNGSYSGQSYVVFGSRSGFVPDFNLSALNGSNGFRINGIAADDRSGGSVSSAGDVNGDGIGDLIIGAARADPNGSASGQSYVVFGSRSGFGADLNLSTLNGSNGFRINGIAASDFSGGSVSSAGDVNGDGIDDLIIGATSADPNGSSSGQSYVVFGVAGDLAGLTLTPPTADASGVTLGSINADLNTGVLTLNFTPRAVTRSLTGFTNVIGTSLDDTITGDAVANTLTGNGGNDAIAGNGGNDVITGGAGNDSLQGGADGDLYLFDATTALGSDLLSDALGVNAIDFSATATQNITLDLRLTTAQTVNSALTLTLGSAVDITNVTGGGGGDRLFGNALNNSLVGNSGDDLLSGGVGADILTGGLGRDRFLFSQTGRFNRNQIGIDSITDFTRRQDKIVLDRATFKGLRKIELATVKNVAQAQRSTAKLTYVRKTGALFFNANGSQNGFGKGGQFADLANGLNLKATDIILGSATTI